MPKKTFQRLTASSTLRNYAPTSVLSYPFKPLKNIVESQIIQEELNFLVIKIVMGPSYSKEDSTQLIESLKERLGNSVQIELDFVDHIPLENSGKFRWVISKVSR